VLQDHFLVAGVRPLEIGLSAWQHAHFDLSASFLTKQLEQVHF
jgi:hypothetical protein